MIGPRSWTRIIILKQFYYRVFFFALGKEAEFTVSRLAACGVAKIRTFSDCQIDDLHVIIWEKCIKLLKSWLKLWMKK